MNEITLNEIKPFLNIQTKFVLRPDATLTITNISSRHKPKDNKNEQAANLEIDLQPDNEKNKITNKKIDGYVFGYQAKRRLKNYVIAAAINGKLDGKNTMFATFTFTNSLVISEYNAPQHDDLLVSVFTKFLNNLKINHGLKNYTWVAERHTGKRVDKNQKGRSSKRGWLHFHTILVFDSYIDVQLLNYLWLKRINNEEKLQCEFSTPETLQKIISLINGNDKSYIDRCFGGITHSNDFYHWYDSVASNHLFHLQKAHFSNSLRWAQATAYETNSIIAIKQLSGFLLNPVDIEFFGYDSKNNCLSKSDSLRKVVSYVTTYISKADNGKDIEEFDGQSFEIEHKIYARIWSASRLFTSQTHKINITMEQAMEFLEKDVMKIIENKIEVVNTYTGEIHEIPVYTAVFNFNIYSNKTYLNYFRDEKHLFPDKSTNSRLLSSMLSAGL